MLRMRTGYAHGYTVVMAEDVIIVTGSYGVLLTYEKVQGFASFVSKAKDLRIGWGEFPDFEVIYLYDKGDSNFGYAVNLADEYLSEWGYAPLPVEQ